VYKVLVGKPDAKNHLEDLGVDGRKKNIKRDLKEIKWEGVDWVHLAHDRAQWWAVLNTVMNLRVP